MGGVRAAAFACALLLLPLAAADTDPDDAAAHAEFFAGEPDGCADAYTGSSDKTSAGWATDERYEAWGAGGGHYARAESKGAGCAGDDTGERGAVFAAWLQDYVHRSPRSTMRTVCMLLP